ncbi:DUF3892 domain-containing protein (plasmid) [Pontibacillus sp. ALD_SL1]|uniref:DUF3892 domain-containing protein n=1 Tax=Pontibacillus sp. ALD_SL1 TaxID=2777185 RepID=UPI001A974D51|nr:DUF3892 domain-containing protein [Pontibacillus sp. ALD_SL1]QST02815.1 DUF3892 domain-containing protein [Pontibacillus sp. ALD_SL1]
MKETIKAVQKNSEGDITAVQTASGRELSIEEAIAETESGNLKGVNTGGTRNGHKTLRSNPDDTTENNLDHLPTF